MRRPDFPIALARELAAIPNAWAPGMLRLRAHRRTLGGIAPEECADWLKAEGRTDSRSALNEAREDGAEGRCVMDLDDPPTVGALLDILRSECRRRRVTLIIEDDWRMTLPEVRLANAGGAAAYTMMPLGHAVGMALAHLLKSGAAEEGAPNA
jgi:hypothetical protein